MKSKINLTFLAILAFSVISTLILTLNTISSGVPIYGAIAGVVAFGGFLYLFIFSRADFRYVVYHTNAKVSGPATLVELDSGLTTIYLGIRTPAQSITVDLQAIPKSALYFGRWEVYGEKDSKLVLWHDHTLFGGGWYYTQH
ncbi:TPA: hypothetical protein DIU27_01890 [Candidatus Collierbacteria bacterium]|uniref:Uncharacterized protein n=1 Tax=Candidatus Collierbacteria bacterium GW2011_GWB2_44_22 TaxID=1618387 RepID=A0A0G1HYL5_9BACT|nr:MAG: hypothetical protein UW31_C0010G0023 [Candidatus Collierbacteria bacterium GW2011_GWA2_44_13]KKT52050.1 MAG: hypothetical protein UW44_C0005G0092 [Candidatus Collierbacteria bacterium GW2011_GWB2_44_22]KKT62619.1 MAG: hypothetical protein UW56_C0005G0055 [Candidatus Collierbacteria bacterium GW2011_GWD1_44_27]KKT66661.1 MAG: hypothetical protein UW58_C0004G0010 [Candidatus Collierbacteria bacterium GW2011_GWC2_44_30]KKT68055.1 MAG: hypothetical protein UW64_C0030G0003 [Microgenomates gr